MEITVPHSNDLETAKTKLNGLADSLGLDIVWDSPTHATGSMDYAGTSVSGEVEVSVSNVTLKLQLPPIGRMVSRRVETKVEKELKQSLA